MEIAKDDHGNIWAHDGTTELCEARGLGGGVSWRNYEQPLSLIESIRRIAMGMPNERDPGNGATCYKPNAQFWTKFQQLVVLQNANVILSIRTQ